MDYEKYLFFSVSDAAKRPLFVTGGVILGVNLGCPHSQQIPDS